MKLIVIIILLISNITISKEFNTTPQSIESIGIPEDYKTVTYDNRYSFSVPEEYEIERDNFSTEFLMFLSNGKVVFTFREIQHEYNPENYELKNYTKRQLLSALYDNNHVSNKLVNESRKLLFGLSNNVAVYQRDGILFFRDDAADKSKFTTSFVISSPVNDKVFSMMFFVEFDEKIKMNFIKSFNPL